MTCEYCGRENPDDAVYCECGRPLGVGRVTTTEGRAEVRPSLSTVELRRINRVKKRPPILILALILGALIIAGVIYLSKQSAKKAYTNESSWKPVSEPRFSMVVPTAFKKSEMTLVGDAELLAFYTSEYAGFDVEFYSYSDRERAQFSSFTAKEFLEVRKTHNTMINGQRLNYSEREGKNCILAEFPRTLADRVSKSDDLWYIQAQFPVSDGYYSVDIYCAQEERSAMRDSMLKWLDSFTIR